MRCFDSSNKSTMCKEMKPLQFSYFQVFTYFFFLTMIILYKLTFRHLLYETVQKPYLINTVKIKR